MYSFLFQIAPLLITLINSCSKDASTEKQNQEKRKESSRKNNQRYYHSSGKNTSLTFFERHFNWGVDRDIDVGNTKYLFISGYSSNSGKSTVTMSLFDILLNEYNIPASDLAYVKPATQCTATQGIWKYCKDKGIDYVGVGSVLYYIGYTAERQETDNVEESESEVLELVKDCVLKCGEGKRFVIVDGVGYPSVGSIVGASNASIAAYLGFPVLLVGRDGLGDAIDTFNMNRCYFETHGTKVLGCIFNRVTDIPYSKKYINLYLTRHGLPHKAYGFLPVLKHQVEKLFQRCCGKGDVCNVLPPSQRSLNITEEEAALFKEMNDNFREHVDWKQIIDDVLLYYHSTTI